MELRGERECSECGTRWSYYETGEITCPQCESVRSVGVDDPTEHTAGPATLDLSPATEAVDEEPFERVAGIAVECAREYLRRAGFIHAGRLEPLPEEYLAAAEIRRTGSALERAMRIEDGERLYFLSLLRGAIEGERPPPGEVPHSLRTGRGLAVAAAADAYSSDIRRLTDDPERAVGTVLSSVRARRKRIEALDGDVDPREAERVVSALRDLGTYLREGDETALVRAGERLDGSGSG